MFTRKVTTDEDGLFGMIHKNVISDLVLFMNSIVAAHIYKERNKQFDRHKMHQKINKSQHIEVVRCLK